MEIVKADLEENQKTKEIIQNIIDNYKRLEESIVSQLGLSNRCHPTTTGTSREMIWLQLFENIIPKKFVIEHSVFIIDSKFNKSREIDLAIIDNTYTPYIFQHGMLKFVPIEAVAAVIECKSKRVEEDGLEKWCRSIEGLRTSRNSIARMANGTVVKGEFYATASNKPNSSSTQTSTRPIRIFCGYESEIGEGEKKAKESFDFWLVAKEGKNESQRKRIEVETAQRDNLQEWYLELDHYEYTHKEDHKEDHRKEDIIQNEALRSSSLDEFRVMNDGEEVSLLSLNLQLNQLLMLINNPILFPHLSYVKMFNRVSQET